MGLKPTQYRCASESLLRRFRKDGSLPRLHPLVDLCNAVSLAFAIPVAVLDLSAVTGPLEVRYATSRGGVPDLRRGHRASGGGRGDLRRPGRAGPRPALDEPPERPAPRSATPPAPTLIVAEALHDSAPADVPGLIAALAAELQAPLDHQNREQPILTAAAPRFTPEATTSGERRDGQ